jgi:hypothetical protein
MLVTAGAARRWEHGALCLTITGVSMMVPYGSPDGDETFSHAVVSDAWHEDGQRGADSARQGGAVYPGVRPAQGAGV